MLRKTVLPMLIVCALILSGCSNSKENDESKSPKEVAEDFIEFIKDYAEEHADEHSDEYEEADKDPHTKGYKSLKYQLEVSRDMLEKVIVCFDTKDKDALKEMLSPAVRSRFFTDSQIENAFRIYGDSSVSHELSAGGSMGDSLIDGRYVERSFDCDTDSLTMDNGDELRIDITRCAVDDNEPDNIGINRILLTTPDWTKLASIGQ